MLPVMRGAIARMGHGLPDKRSAANPIRQTVPLSGAAEPDRPLALSPSLELAPRAGRFREGDSARGAQSNREV